MSAVMPANERERLAALREYQILDTDPEPGFDDLTELAAYICGTPIALVTLIDEDRQWFKSRVGIGISESPRSVSFCTHAILEDHLMIVEDTTKDERFRENPFVKSAPKIRFYAGAPFTSRTGQALGTMCVLDQKPRTLSAEQKKALIALSRQVEGQLEFRRNLMELRAALKERDHLEEEREELIDGLKQSLEDVKRLSGLLPVSSACKFTLTIPAKVSAITPVVDGVLETLRQMKSAEGKEFEVEMALREALANAIVHGCHSDESKHVQCSVACAETGELTLVIRDPGEGFDPAQVADPLTSAHLHDTHGRGVYLINSLVDGVEIVTRKNDPEATGTEVRMRVAGNGHGEPGS
ncbi:MAG: ATP-binding protein [Acidobacteriaceae bacterium]